MTRPKSVIFTQTARVISKVTNPGILSILVLTLMATMESSSTSLLIDLVVVIFIFLVFLPTGYVFMRVRKDKDVFKLMLDPTGFLKQHPRDILVIALLFGISGQTILSLLNAPPIMIYTYAALLVGSFVIALCNRVYRVSYHLGAITILVIMASLAWRPYFSLALIAIPIIGWAKYRIHEHSLVQIVSGASIGALISLAISFIFFD